MCRNGAFFLSFFLFHAGSGQRAAGGGEARLPARRRFDRRAVCSSDKQTDWEPPSSCDEGVVGTMRQQKPSEILRILSLVNQEKYKHFDLCI